MMQIISNLQILLWNLKFQSIHLWNFWINLVFIKCIQHLYSLLVLRHFLATQVCAHECSSFGCRTTYIRHNWLHLLPLRFFQRLFLYLLSFLSVLQEFKLFNCPIFSKSECFFVLLHPKTLNATLWYTIDIQRVMSKS